MEKLALHLRWMSFTSYPIYHILIIIRRHGILEMTVVNTSKAISAPTRLKANKIARDSSCLSALLSLRSRTAEENGRFPENDFLNGFQTTTYQQNHVKRNR